MESKVVGSMSEWSGILMDLHRQIHDGSLTRAHVLALTEHRNPFREDRKLSFAKALKKAYGLLGMEAEYAEFVKEFGNEQAPGMWSLPMVKADEKETKGEVVGYKLTCNEVFAVLKAELLKVDKDAWSIYRDLNKVVADDPVKKIKRNQRDPNRDGSYAVSFKATVEVEAENANQSANERPWESYEDITLLERLFLELVYFLMTGGNLDKKNWTMCAGSRNSDGNVPCVNFRSGDRKVCVGCYGPDSSGDGLRARSAVPKKNS